jgi:uncharacterized protein YyaL (SSP411 family)
MNSLAREMSPYLLQHKDNPVDWRVWNARTLAEAQALDKPILLSVGYAACHWCHVMAHESFEDNAIAALINEHFIPVKVDREERPDIDAVYQNALAMLGQSGGWPLTMFLTPKGEPFWGGTYFPPVSKYGRPAFPDILKKVADVYRTQKDIVATNTSVLCARLERMSKGLPGDMLTADTLDGIAHKIAELIDPVEGGLGRAPKFLQSPALAFLWRSYKRTGDIRFREGVLLTLNRMSQGGIYDHLGGGYARYSTDNEWLVPHFEKMLYDNAQLLELLTWAWQETKELLYRERVVETVEWMLREMRVKGAFAAALDADSEHEEGKFYVWTAAEIDAVLGTDAKLFRSHYDVHRIGNWEGKTILNRSEKPESADTEIEERLTEARAKLLKVREGRVRPGRDHKILADWNGLAIAALSLAACVFGREEWLKAAKEAFDFIDAHMTAEGRLYHSWCDGQTHPGMLDDYAAMVRAALALYQATGARDYLLQAEAWVELLDREYRDEARGGYFLTSSGTDDIIARMRTALDHATPSGNGMMVEVLASLHLLTGKAAYQERAEEQIRAFGGEASGVAIPLASLLSGTDFLLNGIQIVILSGDGTDELVRTAQDCCVPNRIMIVVAGKDEAERMPLAADKKQVGNMATAYVCAGQTCSLPVTDPAALRAILSRVPLLTVG